MQPPRCDSDCQNRRLRMYLVHLCILVLCVILALCHFLVNLLKRRKSKEESRQYYIRKESIAACFPYPQPMEFESIQDAITITTDGLTAMTIEIPEFLPMNDIGNNQNGQNLGPFTNGPHNHNHRPLLQKIVEEDEKKIVKVDIHTESTNQNFKNKSQRGANAITNSPITVAVATVSAKVAAQTQAQASASSPLSNGGHYDPLGSIEMITSSRPQSSHSAFDISDIVNSPDSLKKSANQSQHQSKSKTC